MRCLLLFILMLSDRSNAQLPIVGLGPYRIGITTPDSIQHQGFQESELYVKGTIALPCAHVRAFTVNSIEVAGIVVTNLSLYFYDNKLFKLSCSYNEALNNTFVAAYGNGTPKPNVSLFLCARQPLSIWGEAWQNGDLLAMAVHQEGLDRDCQPTQEARLTIASQSFSALSSDCGLDTGPSLVEEFDKWPSTPPDIQKQPRNGSGD